MYYEVLDDELELENGTVDSTGMRAQSGCRRAASTCRFVG